MFISHYIKLVKYYAEKSIKLQKRQRFSFPKNPNNTFKNPEVEKWQSWPAD